MVRTLAVALAFLAAPTIVATTDDDNGRDLAGPVGLEGRRLRYLLCVMLESRDVETARKALLFIRDVRIEDNVGCPQTLPHVIRALRRLLADPKRDQVSARRLACEVLWRYEAEIGIPVLIEALADPYEETTITGLGPDMPAEVDWIAVWRSADNALRNITAASPVDEPRQRQPIEGQRERVAKAWAEWYRGKVLKPQDGGHELQEVVIEGRYSRVVWLLLNRDGTGMWTGFEPGNHALSVTSFTLSEESIRQLVSVAETLDLRHVKATRFPYRTEGTEYELILRYADGERTIQISRSAKVDPPPDVRRLLDLLWATRAGRQEKPDSAV